MKKLIVGLALASTALASPAVARDGAWYVELNGGVMKLEDMDYDLADFDDEDDADGTVGDVESDYGYDFGGIVGYDFGAFRLEAEASFREADPDELQFTDDDDFFDIDDDEDEGIDLSGDTSALSFMVNALADFGPDDGLQGFIGGGVGVARVETELNAPGGNLIDDSDTGFAWQLLAGVRAPLTENVDVGVKYRFFNADNVDLVAFDGTELETRFRSHSLLGTLTYNFGGVEPMPEPAYVPPPPPPPPPPPVYVPPPPPPPPPVDYRTGERG